MQSSLSRNLWILVLLVLLSASPAIAQEDLRFAFGHTGVGSNYKYVRSDSMYSRESGYGFEPGANILCVQQKSGLERPGYSQATSPSIFLWRFQKEIIVFGSRSGLSASSPQQR